MPMKAKAQVEAPEPQAEPEPRNLDTIEDIANELLPHASEGVKPHLLSVVKAVNSARAAQKTDQSLIRPAPRAGR